MAAGGFSEARLARIGEAMARHVNVAEGGTGVAGMVTMLYRRGELAHVDAQGYRDAEARTPIARDSVFRIASMTKPITTVAALMLREEGRLRFSDPIEKWLPEFAAPRVLRAADGPLDDTVAARKPITVFDLLTHRAGLAYDFTAPPALAALYAQAFNGLNTRASADECVRRLATIPLLFEPGERWFYSVSIDLLGVLIARLSGMSLGEFFRTRILDPLGMRDTGFALRPDQAARMTSAYVFNESTGHVLPVDKATESVWANPERFEGGGGGLVSTADDYLQFARLMLGRGRVDGIRLLSNASVDLMTSGVLSADERRNPTFGLDFWAGQTFGLGLSIVDDPIRRLPLGYRSTGAYSWGGAFGTNWIADPREDMIGVFMIQRRSESHYPVSAEFEELAYAAIED
ncbi:serine hydrolase domain-containing protein [Pararobbsia silviterrae]|uniref:Class A beta-lactamase-related serine hydrolase n=1 Tax=Pararobbsia silviterrae TaxID=1792498 RepID=A0A494YBS0_9BURK|nr:serine hydrolase domain-containing protein [Pararobbsia silviterrae]RKP59220.1 class A beta-lactamase-related serine hydrolase [Pararobbsia silviterrae]